MKNDEINKEKDKIDKDNINKKDHRRNKEDKMNKEDYIRK